MCPDNRNEAAMSDRPNSTMWKRLVRVAIAVAAVPLVGAFAPADVRAAPAVTVTTPMDSDNACATTGFGPCS